MSGAHEPGSFSTIDQWLEQGDRMAVPVQKEDAVVPTGPNLLDAGDAVLNGTVDEPGLEK